MTTTEFHMKLHATNWAAFWFQVKRVFRLIAVLHLWWITLWLRAAHCLVAASQQFATLVSR
jgi:hypothetical protein